MRLLSVSDLAAFCLVVHLSVLDEIRHLKTTDADKDWKNGHENIARFFLVIIGVFYAADVADIGIEAYRIGWSIALVSVSIAIMLAFNARRKKLS